jgi:hypothetical protein
MLEKFTTSKKKKEQRRKKKDTSLTRGHPGRMPTALYQVMLFVWFGARQHAPSIAQV